MREFEKSSIFWSDGTVSVEARSGLLGQKPQTLWFTGLSGSGKSTLAFSLERVLLERKRLSYVLDGDNIRYGLSRDLGFSENDRSENIRRVAEVARLMNDAGLIVIVSLISPLRKDRALARDIIGGERFKEIFVSAPLEVCEARDPKGLYRRARIGEIPFFTGVSAPYQPPLSPDLLLDTGESLVSECLERILDFLSIPIN